MSQPTPEPKTTTDSIDTERAKRIVALFRELGITKSLVLFQVGNSAQLKWTGMGCSEIEALGMCEVHNKLTLAGFAPMVQTGPMVPPVRE